MFAWEMMVFDSVHLHLQAKNWYNNPVLDQFPDCGRLIKLKVPEKQKNTFLS